MRSSSSLTLLLIVKKRPNLLENPRKMIKIFLPIQLSPQVLTFTSKTMATSILSKSRQLSLNLKYLNILSTLRYSSTSTLPADKFKNGPGLKDFLIAGKNLPSATSLNHNIESVPYLQNSEFHGNGRKVFFEIYGCQMNMNDGEVVYSVLKSSGYTKVNTIDEADVVLLLTCSIREGAETKVCSTMFLLAGSYYAEIANRNETRNGNNVHFKCINILL